MSRRSSSLPLLLDAAQSTYDFIPATSITVESIPREMTPHSVIAGEDRTAHPLSQVEAEGPEGWVQRSYMLCIPMHKLSHPMQFGVCFVGVIFFYLLYGYSQEWIFRIEEFRSFGWYLTLLQFAYFSAFGFVESSLKRESIRRIPMATYAVLAFLTVATMGLSNTSLGYLNYPTQVIFKSCKLIPVMLGGMLIQRKQYTMLDVVSMVLTSVGLVLFNLADISVSPSMDRTGILLISLALCADAVIGNVQEKALRQHSASSVEMVLYSYSIGMVYIFIGTFLSGSLLPAFQYCLENPRIYFMAGVFSITGYIGINFVLVLIGTFGTLTAVTVTTFRKALTVTLSFLIFSKPFTEQYMWAGLLVLLGIALNVYCRNAGVKQWTDITMLRLQYWLLGRRKHSMLYDV